MSPETPQHTIPVHKINDDKMLQGILIYAQSHVHIIQDNSHTFKNMRLIIYTVSSPIILSPKDNFRG